VRRIAHQSATEHFGINASAASARVAQSLKHDGRPALPHYETAAVRIEGTARGRRVVGLGEHAHVVKAGGKNRVDRLRCIDERLVALSVANGLERIERGNRARRTRCRIAQAGPGQPEIIGDPRRRRCEIQVLPPWHFGRTKRSTTELVGHPRRGAAARSIRRADARTVFVGQVELAIFNGFLSCRQRNGIVPIASTISFDVFNRSREQQSVRQARDVA
jgi:hypothetical protein